jgi:hypothetical protein
VLKQEPLVIEYDALKRSLNAGKITIIYPVGVVEELLQIFSDRDFEIEFFPRPK